MNAQELFNLAPFGAYVRFFDGTPRPPDQFNKKLRDWKSRNEGGYFVKREHKQLGKDWSSDSFTLQTLNDSVLVINRTMGTTGPLSFEVAPPAVGTILACSKYDDGESKEPDVKHVWHDYNAAKAWAISKYNVYKFSKCGYRYLVVGEDGSLTETTLVDVEG